MFIFPWTPPDVANARIRAWQRRKELRFQARIGAMMAKADRWGLAKSRVARVLAVSAKQLDKVGGA